jgi:hypothetical protein
VAGAAAAVGDEADRRRRELAADLADLEDVVITAYAADVLARLGQRDDDERSAPCGGWAAVAAAIVPGA